MKIEPTRLYQPDELATGLGWSEAILDVVHQRGLQVHASAGFSATSILLGGESLGFSALVQGEMLAVTISL